MALAAFAAQAQPAADTGPAMTVEAVGPHSYYVQGLTQLGSTRNQNFISNAGFVVTPEGVVVVDALGSPGWPSGSRRRSANGPTSRSRT